MEDLTLDVILHSEGHVSVCIECVKNIRGVGLIELEVYRGQLTGFWVPKLIIQVKINNHN